jgi:hypothetical protein
MIDRRHLVLVMTLTATVAVTGCASKVRMSSAKMCQAHGGTYNASTQSCSYTASTRTAKQVCEEQTGYYDVAAQICEFNP